MSDESFEANNDNYGFAATRRIIEYFKEKGVEFFSHADEEMSVVRVPYSTDYMGTFEVFLFSVDDDNDVSVRNNRFIKAVKITPELMAAINECNNRFRFVKFVISEYSLWIGMEMDMLLTTEDPGPTALECCRHMSHIGDEAYPILQRAIWSGSDDDDDDDDFVPEKSDKAVDDDGFSNLLQQLAEHANCADAPEGNANNDAAAPDAEQGPDSAKPKTRQRTSKRPSKRPKKSAASAATEGEASADPAEGNTDTTEEP